MAECTCALLLPTLGKQVKWTLNRTPLMPRIATDSGFRVIDMRITDYETKSTLTVEDADHDISGCLRCMVNGVHSDCLTVRVVTPTLVKVDITVKQLYRKKGNFTSKEDSKWEVIICCTVETESLYVRTNAQFLPKVNDNSLRVPYYNTTKWETVNSKYLKRHEFRTQLKAGSRVECRLQDLEGMEFCPEKSKATTFFPRVDSTQNSSTTDNKFQPTRFFPMSELAPTSSIHSTINKPESKESNIVDSTATVNSIVIPLCIAIGLITLTGISLFICLRIHRYVYGKVWRVFQLVYLQLT